MRFGDDYDEIWTIAGPISSTQLASAVTQRPIICSEGPQLCPSRVAGSRSRLVGRLNSIFLDSTIKGWRGSLQENDRPSRYNKRA
jgi:hypothetical protein